MGAPTEMVATDLRRSQERRRRYKEQVQAAESELTIPERQDREEARVAIWGRDVLSEWRECGRPLRWVLDATGIRPKKDWHGH